MEYEDIKAICRMNKISVQTIASEVGLSLDGLKRGFIAKSIAMKYIPQLCKSLCVTPNRLFGFEDHKQTIQQTQNGGVGNSQIAGTDTEALRQQLAEKDAQISRLLGIIESRIDKNKN